MLRIKPVLVTCIIACATAMGAATSNAQDAGSKFLGIASLAKDGSDKINQLGGLTGDPFACPGGAHGDPLPHGPEMTNLGGQILADFDRISIDARYPGNPSETFKRIAALASDGIETMKKLNGLVGDLAACPGGPHGIPIPHGRDMTNLGNQIVGTLNGIDELTRP